MTHAFRGHSHYSQETVCVDGCGEAPHHGGHVGWRKLDF